jgi:hypothetical protein
MHASPLLTHSALSGPTLQNNLLTDSCMHARKSLCEIVDIYPCMHLFWSSDNRFYHNNFIDNTLHVNITIPGCANFWDDGYSSGGNYWSDHVTVDDCCGINQDEPGSDGIVDEPYVIDANNCDNYPLVEPWSPVIYATIDIDPDTLNFRSVGKWITAYIQLPIGYNAEDIDATTILFNETIQPVLDPMYEFVTNSSEYLVDHDEDGILERMVKFDKAEVMALLGVGETTLTITGEVNGASFEGSYSIRVIFPSRRFGGCRVLRR